MSVQPKVVLCDIEGTTTSISFVKDILFPYATNHVENYLKANWETDETKLVVASIRQQLKEDHLGNIISNTAFIVESESLPKDQQIANITKYVKFLIEKDRKVGPLKVLQGLIWKNGYEDGSIRAHVYDDVPNAFKWWTDNGIKLYIYSSGSVEAQKLLFSHTIRGDLLPFITGHFDTTIGHKQFKNSYENILNSLNVDPLDVWFLTDIANEGKAANEANINVIVLDRPGNAPLSDDDRNQFRIEPDFNFEFII